MKALDAVMADVAKAKAEAAKAKAEAVKVRADAAKAKREAKSRARAEGEKTFDIAVGGQKLAGVSRDEAMKALKLERGKLHAQLEGGWAYHVDQMNLPNEVPFQAWLTSGVDALKSFVKGQDAAKIPDLDIWDPARDMMNEVKKAERQGDVEAIAALLPKIAAAIPKARSQVSKYQDQMEGSAADRRRGRPLRRGHRGLGDRCHRRGAQRRQGRQDRRRSPARRPCSRAWSNSPSG